MPRRVLQARGGWVDHILNRANSGPRQFKREGITPTSTEDCAVRFWDRASMPNYRRGPAIPRRRRALAGVRSGVFASQGGGGWRNCY